ncbi:MAG: maleylpyruvate isomerase N-terminal domain-containing protein [Candidatus Dormibacteria bacterium]
MSQIRQNADFRTPFIHAANGLVELVKQIPSQSWDTQALGVWTLRDLVGHACRAITTVEEYLAQNVEGPIIMDSAEYFLLALANSSDPERKRKQDAAIAARGIEAGQRLGSEPHSRIAKIAERVCEKVSSTDGTVLLGTPVGPMPLSAYLPTRTFELAVHGCDIAHVLSIPPPKLLDESIASACELAGRIASHRENAAAILLLMTGRTGVPEGTSVL